MINKKKTLNGNLITNIFKPQYWQIRKTQNQIDEAPVISVKFWSVQRHIEQFLFWTEKYQASVFFVKALVWHFSCTNIAHGSDNVVILTLKACSQHFSRALRPWWHIWFSRRFLSCTSPSGILDTNIYMRPRSVQYRKRYWGHSSVKNGGV